MGDAKRPNESIMKAALNAAQLGTKLKRYSWGVPERRRNDPMLLGCV
jgi:hypothetical protein